MNVLPPLRSLISVTRVVLDKVGSVLERYNYYPYGEIVPVSVASSGNTDYLYTGKESQNALFGINWYDSAARFQTTDGIFTGIDPLAEKYYHISPYAYCAGNPIDTKRVVKAAGIGAATGLVGAALNVGTNAASATVEKTIEKKYASSTVKDTYRNDWRTKEYLERNHS